MSALLNYLNAQDKNALARAAHLADPVKSMISFGLTVDEQDVLLSGDKYRLADAMKIPSHELSLVVYVAPIQPIE
ncbi:MAG: hypothetical protein JO269_10785 [Burkholderiaceae bacterium]|nr:hypothetical protein [Burkholderiaceae bacterium]